MHVYVVDFAWHGNQTLFIELNGTDDNRKFEGMVRVVDGIIYGDLVHPTKSTLSKEAISYIKNYVSEQISAKKF